jgi:hypothetical protein
MRAKFEYFKYDGKYVWFDKKTGCTSANMNPVIAKYYFNHSILGLRLYKNNGKIRLYCGDISKNRIVKTI